MDKEAVVNIVKRYADVVRRHFPVTRVVLYGSYATDNQRPYSDIDVAVVVEKLEKDILASEFELHKLRREVDEGIEPVLFIEGYDPSGFLAHIESTGITVYSAETASVGK